LAIAASDLPNHHDLDIGGLNLVSLAIACNFPNYNPHVDRCHPSPHSWLQLPMTLVVVMILILVVWVLHLLCLHLL